MILLSISQGFSKEKNQHTKIEEFRSRLSPEVQRTLANTLAQSAVKLGFGDPREVDFDSTIQEANVAYPSDASLMTKLVGNAGKLVEYIRKNCDHLIPEKIRVDFKAVKKKAGPIQLTPYKNRVSVTKMMKILFYSMPPN